MNQTFYIIPSPYDARHHGVLGMKWGIRRYQNKDGTLTPEGRKRLGYDKYSSEDTIIPKGTKVNRVISDSDISYVETRKEKKQLRKQLIEREKNLEEKYVSVDNFRDNKKINGEDFYVGWFTDGGLDPDPAYIDRFVTNQKLKVASGQKVMDKILNEIGNKTVEEYLKDESPYVYAKISLKYTTDRELHKAVNDYFAKQGYDAIEDVNDILTSMPIIILNSKSKLDLVESISAKKWLDKRWKEYEKEKSRR